MLDKCTAEKNDRDDVSFEMSFDYEFVEDFFVEKQAEDETMPPAGVPNVRFSGGSRREGVPGVRGEREDGETAVVELTDVTVVEEGKDGEEKEEEDHHLMGGVGETEEDGYLVITDAPPPLSVGCRQIS